MKQLREHFEGNELSAYLQSELIEEGAVGDFFKKTFNYLKGKIAQIGNYFVALFNDKVLPAITPITSQMALKNGDIPDAEGIHWVGNSEDAKYSKVKTDGQESINARPSTVDTWKAAAERKGIKEGLEDNRSWDEIMEALKLANDDKSIRNIDGAELEHLAEVVIRNGVKAKPLLIWGAPGVGKTAIINKVLKAIKGENSRMLDMQLSMKEHDDFFLPTYSVDKTKAVDVPKSYLPVWEDRDDMTEEERKAANEACGTGLIFLDELCRAKPQVQAVCLKLVDERKLGDKYRLGDGWSIISASNRLEDDEESQHQLSTALGNRFRQVNYSPTVKSWRKWADSKGYMNKHVLDWLEQNEKYFYYQDEWDGVPSSLFCTPRAWEGACKALADESYTADEEGFDLMALPDNIIMAAIQDNVGLTAAQAFMDYVKLMRTVDVNKLQLVLTDPDKAPLPQKSGSGYKLDILYIITTYIISFCKEQPTPKEFENMAKYYARLKDESAAGKWLKSICTKFPDINDHFGEGDNDDKYLGGIQVLIGAYPEWENANFDA